MNPMFGLGHGTAVWHNTFCSTSMSRDRWDRGWDSSLMSHHIGDIGPLRSISLLRNGSQSPNLNFWNGNFTNCPKVQDYPRFFPWTMSAQGAGSIGHVSRKPSTRWESNGCCVQSAVAFPSPFGMTNPNWHNLGIGYVAQPGVKCFAF